MKIKIMGAGISGLTAAINLAKAGYSVDVFEKRSDCGKRFNGDLEGLENWSSHIDILEEIESRNISINFDCYPFSKMHITDGREIIEVSCKRPIFYLVKRGAIENSLDQGLKNQALDQGVNIIFNSKVRKEEVDIISTGPNESKAIGIAKGIRFETEHSDIAVVLLNKEAAYKMYSYLLIVEGYGCMCSVNHYECEPIKYFKKTYEIFNKVFNLRIRNKKNVGGVGCFLLKPKCVEKGKLYTGEAAGLQDLVWGFGMRYAIASGYFAAISISRKENYKKLIKENLYGRLKTSIVNRYFLEKLGDRYYSLLFEQVKKHPDLLDLLYKGSNPSLYSKIIYPFAKFSLFLKYDRIR